MHGSPSISSVSQLSRAAQSKTVDRFLPSRTSNVGQWIWLAALHIAAKGASITTSNLTIRCDACAIARSLNASSPAASYASTHLAVDGTHLLTSWPQPTQPTQPSQQPAARDESTAANIAEPESLPSARQRRVASLRAAFTRP